MIKRLKLQRRHIKLIGIIILILTLPLTLVLVKTAQDQRSSAALPDKLETEQGVLSSSGVSKQNDSNASGGQYILFASNSGGNGLEIEAESFDSNISRGSNSWTVENSLSGASGGSYVVASPDSGNFIQSPGHSANASELTYQINFPSPGTYYVWILGNGPDEAGNSVHIGLGSQESADADNFETAAGSSWKWSNYTRDGNKTRVNVPSGGTHTLNMWIREDGTRVDKILLTQDASFKPEGTIYTPSTTTPTPVPSSTNKIYGPGLNIDSKNNFIIGYSYNRTLSYRFRASTTSRAVSVSWELRTGSGYSKGDGGALKISIQTDDGSANHFPSGQVLDSYTFIPGNDTANGIKVRQNFPGKPLLNEGQIYHIVFENIDPDSLNNWVSVNAIFTFKTYNPRQPNPKLVGDFAVLYRMNGNWAYKPNDTAQMDLAYEDGTHDGQAYSGAVWEQPGSSNDTEQIGRVEGQRQTREIFTVQGGDKIVTAAFIRVAQEYGSGDLTISLKNSLGTVLGQGKVSASQISDYAAEPGWYTDPRTVRPTAGDWVSVSFNNPITLKNGSTYQLVMTAPSGTRYALVPISYGTWDDVKLESFAFREGRAQQSNDGGNSWENNYAYQPTVNYQFYLTLQ